MAAPDRLDRTRLDGALTLLGQALADRGLRYHIVILGGAALLLTEGGARPTQDVDVAAVAADGAPLRPIFDLPDGLREAVADVAATLGLPPDWMNAGAGALVGRLLPDGYDGRLRTRSVGGLTISVVARADLLRPKLYAGADEGPGSTHLHDVIEMAPSRAELDEATAWVNARYPGGLCPGIDEVRQFLESSR